MWPEAILVVYPQKRKEGTSLKDSITQKTDPLSKPMWTAGGDIHEASLRWLDIYAPSRGFLSLFLFELFEVPIEEMPLKWALLCPGNCSFITLGNNNMLQNKVTTHRMPWGFGCQSSPLRVRIGLLRDPLNLPTNLSWLIWFLQCLLL